MKGSRTFIRMGGQILCMGFFAMLLVGCVTCVDCNKSCGGGDGVDPITCVGIPLAVNELAACPHATNPGFKCDTTTDGKKCPFSTSSKTCKTVPNPNVSGACQCKCSS